MTEQVAEVRDIWLERFSALEADPRPGYGGYLVKANEVRNVCTELRDRFGYDYLTCLTGVDYYPEDRMEVVYHLSRTIGGQPLVLRAVTGREKPALPSVTPVWPGAEFQEREVWDLFGIRFRGHPDLRRILMWEGFAGHPLRKDWKEPYYEEENKPFKSRWPDGQVFRAEDRNPLGANITIPEGMDIETLKPDLDAALYNSLRHALDGSESEIRTDRIMVNLGPQHPSTHGVFRMAAVLDGETVVDLKPVFGYLHRNHEKIGERCTWIHNMAFTDRLDYISSMSNNFGYAVAVEKLTQVKPPIRAEYIRVMMAELTRIMSHLVSIGFLLNDVGAYFTPVLYCLEERELILDIFEAVSGSRMMCNYFRFGGVARDLPEGIIQKVDNLVNDRIPRKLDSLEDYLTHNEIFRLRCEGIGVLTDEEAIAYSMSGPMLRASGVPYDIRRVDPYSIYDQLEFDVVVRQHGDVYDRYLVRVEEIRQSLRILRQVLRDIPEGPIQTGKLQWQTRVPAGEAYGRVEGPKGELGFYLVSNGKGNPWRYHVRPPCFINLTSLAKMCQGSKVADSIVILGAVDIVLGEVDR